MYICDDSSLPGYAILSTSCQISLMFVQGADTRQEVSFFVNTIISALNEISWKVTLICFFFVIYSSVFPFFLKTRFYSYEKNALLTLVLNLSHLISFAVLIIPPATNDRWQFFVTLWFQNHCNYINGKAYALITLT